MKKNLIDSLKELVVAFGGAENIEAVKGSKIIEVLKKLKEAIVSSGAADHGPLILEFATLDPSTVDTPLSEIKAAIEAGKQVWFTAPTGNNFPLTSFHFDGANVTSLQFGSQQISYNENTGWTYMR